MAQRKGAQRGGLASGRYALPRTYPINQLVPLLADARAEARRIVDYMADQNPDDTFDAESREVLTEIVTIVKARGPHTDEKTGEVIENAKHVYPARDRIAAGRLFLDFTRQKPAQRNDVTVRTAEDFLDEIADEMETGADE